MPLVGYCASDRDGSSGTALTETMTFPAGTQAGHVCTIVASCNTSQTATAGSITGSDWTIKHGVDNVNNVIRTYVWSHALTQAEVDVGSVVVTWSGTGRINGTGVVMSGVTPADTTAAAYNSAASNTVALPTIATAIDGSEIVVATVTRVLSGSAALVTLPAIWTKDGNSSTNNASGVNFNVVAGHRTTPVPAGTYGGGTVTTSPAASHIAAYLIVLNPSTTPPPTTPTYKVKKSDGTVVAGNVLGVWDGTTLAPLTGSLVN